MTKGQVHSSGYGIDESQRPDPWSSLGLNRLSRYDLVLAVIPMVFVVAWFVGLFSGLPLWLTAAVGGLLALPLVVDVLAFNPPS